MADNDQLAAEILTLLKSGAADRLCRGHEPPIDAAGYLYINLQARLATQNVRNMQAWVRSNGLFHLRNYLKAERRTMLRQQRQEH